MRRTLSLFWNDFHQLSMLAASITGLLCATLLSIPELIHWLFQIDSNDAADVMSRRAAMLFLGLSVILYGARTAPASPLRGSIALGIVLCMGGLLALGLFEYLRGAVGVGIFLAILVEAFFAAAFLKFWMVRV